MQIIIVGDQAPLVPETSEYERVRHDVAAMLFEQGLHRSDAANAAKLALEKSPEAANEENARPKSKAWVFGEIDFSEDFGWGFAKLNTPFRTRHEYLSWVSHRIHSLEQALAHPTVVKLRYKEMMGQGNEYLEANGHAPRDWDYYHKLMGRTLQEWAQEILALKATQKAMTSL